MLLKKKINLFFASLLVLYRILIYTIVCLYEVLIIILRSVLVDAIIISIDIINR